MEIDAIRKYLSDSSLFTTEKSGISDDSEKFNEGAFW